MEVLARKQGASDLTVLRDEAVTRSTVEDALHAVGLRSKPGDWILFYYSGHGSQAEARVKGTRDGDFDQFLPLARFDPDDQDPERFIVDKDIYEWLSRYIPRDVQILMLADTCHSGTLHRSVDQRSYRFKPRLALRAAAASLQLVARPGPKFPSLLERSPGDVPSVANSPDREDLPNLVFLAAAQDDELAQELAMPDEDGPSRGLLTYAFEQGVMQAGPDGKTLLADLDGDGAVTTSEIAVYVDGQVRYITGERQRPRASYVTGKESLKLFAQADVAPRKPENASLPSVYAVGNAGKLRLNPDSPFWRMAPAADKADFVWDLPNGDVIRRTGDVVAQGVDTAAAFDGVLEKWHAIEALRPMLNESRAKIAIGPLRSGARYPMGVELKVALSIGDAFPAAVFATIFNVAADGTMQVIFPATASDGKGQLPPGNVLPLIEAKVVAPFGVDHVVAVVSDKEPAELRALLQVLDGQRGVGQLVDPITRLLAAGSEANSISIAQIYTAGTAAP